MVINKKLKSVTKLASGGQKTITISKNVDNIAFTGNGEQPNSLKEFLISATMGSDTTQLASSCFMDCENLTTVNVPLKCKTINDYAFKGCTKLNDTNILSGGAYSVQLIGNHAFDGCNGLQEININLKGTDSTSYHIGEYAFANCNSLKSVTWQNYSYLGGHMFSGCQKLSSLNIPNNSNYVFPYSLAEIPNIKDITIPSKIWVMSEGCFKDCKNLSSINIIDTEQSKSKLDTVENCVFYGCEKLSTITFPEAMNDMSCFEPYALSGSNVSRVVMKGMDDEKFVTNYKEIYNIENTGYIKTLKEFKNIQDIVVDKHIPLVIFTSHNDIGKPQYCGICNTLISRLTSNRWKEYMNSHLSVAYFVYASEITNENFWEAVSYKQNLSKKFLEIMPNWEQANSYAKAMALMVKEDGKVIYNQAHFGSLDDFMNKIDEIVKNAPGIVYNPELNVSITKLGSPLPSIKYVSKQGHEFECTTQSKVEYTPEVRVDKQTTSDFKYGTWYYNAKELREYADTNHIPVFAEYSSQGCKPCTYFRKNVYNDSYFQSWVDNSKYLFCRIEVDPSEGFNQPSKYPQPYYLKYVWAKEKYGENPPYPPGLMWYWKKEGDTTASVFEVKSYHFDTQSGEPPPYSNQELMDMTDNFFRGYTGDSSKTKKVKTNLYTSDNRHMGYYYTNEDGDDNGKYFTCDSRKKISEYSSRIDIEGYQVIPKISEGMTVDFPARTYQYFTASDQNFPDMEGIIFKVITSGSENKVSCLYEFENNYDYKKDQKYINAVWYDLDNTSESGLFSDIIKDSESMDYSVVILKTTNNSACEAFETNIKNSDPFQKWVSSKHQTYFIEVKVTASDFSSGIGKEFKDFYDTSWRQMPTWNDSMPQFVIYEACSSCSAGDTPLLTLHSIYVPGSDNVETIKTTLDTKLSEKSE